MSQMAEKVNGVDWVQISAAAAGCSELPLRLCIGIVRASVSWLLHLTYAQAVRPCQLKVSQAAAASGTAVPSQMIAVSQQ